MKNYDHKKIEKKWQQEWEKKKIYKTLDFSKKIKQIFRNKILKENKNLVEVILKSPKQIETTTGVISYLYSLLGENGINIYETLSCWTDTIFLIEEKYLSRVVELLMF